MSSASIRFSLLLPFFLLLVLGCSKTTEPVESEHKVDQSLLGDWYYLDEFFADHPAPEIEVQGIRIAPDLSLKDLAVETNTGELAVWDTYPTDIYAKDIVAAENGTLIVRYTQQNRAEYDTLLYTIKDDTLTLSWPDNSVKLVYQRSLLGAPIREPIHAQFEVLIEAYSNSPLKAFDIFPYPATYASRTSESTLMIKAWLPETKINIRLDDFHGVGSYSASAEDYLLIRRNDDYSVGFDVNPIEGGSVTIERYDEAANICSGTFTLHLHSISDSLDLKEGKFSVPIYK